jgi:type IV secretion system protein VirB4
MPAAYRSAGLHRRLATKEAPIGDRLPYLRHLNEGTVLTRDGLLIQVLRLDGFPFETVDNEELNYRKQVRESLYRGAANSRLALYHHIVRRRVTPELAAEFDDPFCARLDRNWREKLAERRLFVNELFLTLVRRPLQGNAGFAERLFRSAARESGNIAAELRALDAVRENFVAALAPYGARLLTTYRSKGGLCSEPCAFLSALVTGEMRPVLAPGGDIGQALADRRLTFGLEAMEFAAAGNRPATYAAAISLKDYPLSSSPGMLDSVVRLPCEMVLTQSFAFVDRQATLDRMNLALRRMRAADDAGLSARDDLHGARDAMAAGRSAYGEHHLSIVVKAESLEALNAAAAEAQSALSETGAVAVREDVNLEPVFWAQFPGNFKYIARQALVSTANFSSFAAFPNHPQGAAQDNHWGEAVSVLETTAFGPYFFNFHNGDLGNFTVIGPSGSGKTVLLTFLTAQARKFRPKVFYFDKDRGAEIFIRAVRGRYDSLRPGEPTGLNPLQVDDTPANRAFLADWLAQLLSVEGLPLDAEDRALIVDAIDANFSQPKDHRRLRYLRELFIGARRPSAGDLAARLKAWCDDGEHAWLFDNAEDMITFDQDVFGFDMTRILDTPVTRTPAMMYLFHRIEQQLDGSATIIVVDEGWKALDDEVFVSRVRDWEKTIRKRNGVVGFCTQNASDALESRIGPAIIEQTATQIFFPNPKARPADYIGGFGLSEHEFDLVRTLPDTSRCFLIKQADHSVVARLDLTGLAGELKVLAGTERSVRQLDAIRAEVGDDPDAWMGPFTATSDRRVRAA